MIEALRRDRYIAVTLEGTVYEVRETNDGFEQRKITPYGRRAWGESNRGRFAMYARIGFHAVNHWYVTDGEYTKLLGELFDFSDTQRYEFAADSGSRVHPPEED